MSQILHSPEFKKYGKEFLYEEICMTSENHTFDITLAAKFGIEEAIIIHHFQHWIRINRNLNRNFIEGKTWSYQSRKEIAAHFPYINEDKVRRIIENLVEIGVLISKNFNKNRLDHTLWYAFADEMAFVPIIEGISKNPYERQICQIERQNCQIERQICQNIYSTDTKTTDTSPPKNIKKGSGQTWSKNSEQPKNEKQKNADENREFIESVKRKYPEKLEKSLKLIGNVVLIETSRKTKELPLDSRFTKPYLKDNFKELFGINLEEKNV